MTTANHDLLLRSTLVTVRTTYRRVRAAEGVALTLAVALAIGLGACIVDNLFTLGTTLRCAAVLAFFAGTGAVAWKALVRPLSTPLSDDAMAILVERRYPDLQNRLINAVQLGREGGVAGGAVPLSFLSILKEDASRAVEGLHLGAVVSRRALKRFSLAAAGASAALVAYALLFPSHLSNALQRYAHPTRFVAPITRTTLRVTPGHVRCVRGETLRVVAEVGGEIPASATILIEGGGLEPSCAMEPAADATPPRSRFAYVFPNVDGNFRYHVEAGDAESETFRVTVTEKPAVTRLTLTYRFPAYTRLPPKTEEGASGDIAALAGTEVAFQVWTNKPIRRGALAAVPGGETPLSAAEAGSLRGVFKVTANGTYRLLLESEDGLTDPDPPTRRITLLEDRAPTVEIKEPGKNVTLGPDGELPIVAIGKDDFGLVSLELVCKAGNAEEAPRGRLSMETPSRESRWGTLLRLAPLGLKPDDTLTYYVRATDTKGATASSRSYSVRLQPAALERKENAAALARILDRIRKLLEEQRAVRADSGRVQKVAASAPKALPTESATLLGRVAERQSAIASTSIQIVKDWTDPTLAESDLKRRFSDLVAGLLPRASTLALTARQAKDGVARKGPLDELLKVQDAIIAFLEGILKESSDALTAIQQGLADKPLDPGLKSGAKDEAKDLLDKLRAFIADQKSVIVETEKLKQTAPEDWGQEEQAKLDELKAKEEEWGKIFEGKASDLSKLPPQDFSNSKVAQELLETYSELEDAATALEQKKTVEMAVPAEQAGLELAEETEANLEKWLSTSPDYQKWNMEEPTQDVDVPMSDLPEELEDIIGDVLDSEETMSEETEDVTSSWMDSLDKGAGWGVSDGPISNMSAKGITGNLQPNSQEVGGRSGEGRQGKSSGQFVEDHADGREGNRETPSRSTEDPYEAGQVKDSYDGPTGGSTGGGKTSGAGQEGLRGTPPPETAEKMKKLATQQSAARSQAEKLDYVLEKRRYTSDDLKQAIELMKQFEADLKRFKGQDYEAKRKEIVEKIRAVQKIVEAEIDRSRDLAAPMPKELRDELQNALDEQAPEEFRDLVKEYYKTLSEGK